MGIPQSIALKEAASSSRRKASHKKKESLKSLWREETVPARGDRVISKRKLGW